MNETYTDDVGVTTSVADTFEKFKNVAPEEFGHLIMPERFGD